MHRTGVRSRSTGSSRSSRCRTCVPVAPGRLSFGSRRASRCARSSLRKPCAGPLIRWRAAHQSCALAQANKNKARECVPREKKNTSFLSSSTQKQAMCCRPVLRVRSTCAAFVLAHGRQQPSAHDCGCLTSMSASRSKSAPPPQRRIMGMAAPNPSIERTSKRLRLFAAAHVERYAS
jgi:hypothetical protein